MMTMMITIKGEEVDLKERRQKKKQKRNTREWLGNDVGKIELWKLNKDNKKGTWKLLSVSCLEKLTLLCWELKWNFEEFWSFIFDTHLPLPWWGWNEAINAEEEMSARYLQSSEYLDDVWWARDMEFCAIIFTFTQNLPNFYIFFFRQQISSSLTNLFSYLYFVGTIFSLSHLVFSHQTTTKTQRRREKLSRLTKFISIARTQKSLCNISAT